MDERIGTCKTCGGYIIYISSLNKIICDTCEHEVVEVI